MAYTKPTIIAQNSAAGSYAAGCPAQDRGPFNSTGCRACDRAE